MLIIARFHNFINSEKSIKTKQIRLKIINFQIRKKYL